MRGGGAGVPSGSAGVEGCRRSLRWAELRVPVKKSALGAGVPGRERVSTRSEAGEAEGFGKG